MKLQFISIKTELIYIGRRKTMSLKETDTWVNKSRKIMHPKGKETQISKGCHFFWPTLYITDAMCDAMEMRSAAEE